VPSLSTARANTERLYPDVRGEFDRVASKRAKKGIMER
jgi:hypothetical protein